MYIVYTLCISGSEVEVPALVPDQPLRPKIVSRSVFPVCVRKLHVHVHLYMYVCVYVHVCVHYVYIMCTVHVCVYMFCLFMSEFKVFGVWGQLAKKNH